MMKPIWAAVIALMMAGAANASEITFGRGETGHLFFPQDADDAPAVLLLHDWSGPSEKMQLEAQRFADQGYVVLMPDMFAGKSPATPEAARALMMHEDIDAQRIRLKRTITDALTYLSVRPSVDADDIALVGFDFGATVALKAGMEGLNVDAVVAFEPLPNLLAKVGPVDFENADMPILTHFAETQADGAPIQFLEQELVAQNKANKVYHYPIVDPGFSITTDGQYDAVAAKLARKRTLDFLDKNR
ncbi:MAG: dienelactone hydrolase family protein [Shimia thalassica]|uniref:dienelactone hydrolase family protein n=1 Tax=Shimia thalassica TaxID=1715693 RepID=UPI0032975130